MGTGTRLYVNKFDTEILASLDECEMHLLLSASSRFSPCCCRALLGCCLFSVLMIKVGCFVVALPKLRLVGRAIRHQFLYSSCNELQFTISLVMSSMFRVQVISSPIASQPSNHNTSDTAPASSRRVSERISALRKRFQDEDATKSATGCVESTVNERNSPRKVMRLKKGDTGYGSPPAGSKSADRAVAASDWVNTEIEKLISIIENNASAVDPVTGEKSITFGDLFNIYQDVSTTLVGTLQRARKRNLIAYEGEMLYQGKHDADVRITVLRVV